ncbi:unnamed protein product [Rotaria magnacalcarata]
MHYTLPFSSPIVICIHLRVLLSSVSAMCIFYDYFYIHKSNIYNHRYLLKTHELDRFIKRKEALLSFDR